MRAGHPEWDAGKNKEGVCPLCLSDLLVFLWSSQRPALADIPTDGLHMGFLTVFTKTASRYKRALKAGWSSRRPFTGTHKDRLPFYARGWSFQGCFKVFAKTMLRYKGILQAVWSFGRPFSDAYKDHLSERKKELPPEQHFQTARVTALPTSLFSCR